MGRILLVQDDFVLSGNLERLLHARGHEVATVQTAGAALREFEAARPDLLVCAIALPDQSGPVLVGRIRALPGGRRLPVILTSQVYRVADVEASQLSRLGIRYFLAKPFSVTDVLRRIDSLIPPVPLPAAEPVRDGSQGSTQEIDLEGMDIGRRGAARASSAAPDRESTREVTVGIGRPRSGQFSKPPAPVTNRPPAQNKQDHFVRTVADLFHSRASGKLKLQATDSDHTLYFLNGYPVWVDVDPPLLGVPEWLQEQGRLTKAQALKAASAQARLGWGITRVLVSQQVMTAEQLDPLLQRWVEHELGQAAGRPGRLEFEAGDSFSESIPVYETNPISVLWGVIHKTLRLGTAEIGLSRVEEKFVRRRPSRDRLFGYVATTSVLQELRDWLAQARSFEAIREYFESEWEQVARCLWFLVQSEVVEVLDTDPEDPEATPLAGIATLAFGDPESDGEATARFSKAMIAQLVEAAEHRTEEAAESDDPEVRVIRHYVTRMEMDHYAFLEVDRGVGKDDLVQAFDRAADRYRPRSLPEGVRDDTRRKAKELLSRAARAYRVLADEPARRAYDAGLGDDQATGSWDTAEVLIDEDTYDDESIEFQIEVSVEDDDDDDWQGGS